MRGHNGVAVVTTLTPGYIIKPLRGNLGTAEPAGYSPAELVVYGRELALNTTAPGEHSSIKRPKRFVCLDGLCTFIWSEPGAAILRSELDFLA
jgi:hypothetical protein